MSGHKGGHFKAPKGWKEDGKPFPLMVGGMGQISVTPAKRIDMSIGDTSQFGIQLKLSTDKLVKALEGRKL